MSKAFTATAVLITTMIGAGFLGIPYVVSQSGFAIGTLELIIIGGLVMLTMLYLGEIVLRTKEHHQLTGYAEKYLGPKGKRAMAFALIAGIYAALIAYLIAQSQSWSFIITNTTDAALPLGIAVWAIMSAITYFDIKALKKTEALIITLISILLVLLVIVTLPLVKADNLTTFVPAEFLAPIGVIMFAFLGYSAIPEMTRILGKDKHAMKKSICVAHALVLATYALFTILVLGAYGTSTPEIATLALGKPFVLLGIVTMLGAYLALSIALMDAFQSDYQLKKREAWAFTTIIPLALYVLLTLTNNASFIKILGIGGIISGSLAMVLILLMVQRAKIHGDRHPEYKMPYSSWLIWLIIIVCIVAMIAEILKLM